MSGIPDFTQVELWTVQSTVDEPWGAGTGTLMFADVDLKPKPGEPEKLGCPARG